MKTCFLASAALLAAIVPGAGTGSAQAAPITFTSQTSAVETYFQSDPAISATVQFQGLADTFDLTTGVGVHARFLLFYVGTGAADPGVSGIEYRPFSVGLTVQGITRYFEFDLGVQERACRKPSTTSIRSINSPCRS